MWKDNILHEMSIQIESHSFIHWKTVQEDKKATTEWKARWYHTSVRAGAQVPSLQFQVFSIGLKDHANNYCN